MKHVNLLPKTEQTELRFAFFSEKLLRFWIWAAVSLAIFFTLSFLSEFYLNGIMSSTQLSIVDNKVLLDSSDFRALQNEILVLNRDISEIANLQSRHYYWSKAFVEFANLVPADMQMDQVIFDSATGKIIISGQAKTRQSMLALWANVIKSEYFENINFPLTNLEKPENPDFTYTFFVKRDKFKTE